MQHQFAHHGWDITLWIFYILQRTGGDLVQHATGLLKNRSTMATSEGTNAELTELQMTTNVHKTQTSLIFFFAVSDLQI